MNLKRIIIKKCICISNIIRNLSFISDNAQELCVEQDFISIISKLILYKHNHDEKKPRNVNFNIDQINLNSECQRESECKSEEEQSKETWWFNTFKIVQENVLVALTNMSAHLNFNNFNEELSLPILKGLLHWTLCPSSVALDNFSPSSSFSPKTISLECLSKLVICEQNVDLLLNTPPLNYYNLDAFASLVNLLSRSETQLVREFVLVILYNFIISDPSIARAICCSSEIIGQLIAYLKQYEESLKDQQIKEQTNQSSTPNQLNNSPSTTSEMAIRATSCLICLAKVHDNRLLFTRYGQAIMELTTSSFFNHALSKKISEITFEIQQDSTNQTYQELN